MWGIIVFLQLEQIIEDGILSAIPARLFPFLCLECLLLGSCGIYVFYFNSIFPARCFLKEGFFLFQSGETWDRVRLFIFLSKSGNFDNSGKIFSASFFVFSINSKSENDAILSAGKPCWAVP